MRSIADRFPPPVGRRAPSPRAAGFTLIETLVALTLVVSLLAVIVPVVTQQLDARESAGMSSDLAAFRRAATLFQANTGVYPAYLSHLANPISTADSTIDLDEYSARQARSWNGPYLREEIPPDLRLDPALELGELGIVQNFLVCFDAEQWPAPVVLACEPGQWAALWIDGLRIREFEALNDIIDGEAEPDGIGSGQSKRNGKLWYLGNAGFDGDLTVVVVLYLIGPYQAR